jgi:hypothetical protein
MEYKNSKHSLRFLQSEIPTISFLSPHKILPQRKVFAKKATLHNNEKLQQGVKC